MGIPIAPYARRESLCALLQVSICDGIVGEDCGKARLGGYGRLQERIRHLERVHAAFEERVEIRITWTCEALLPSVNAPRGALRTACTPRGHR